MTNDSIRDRLADKSKDSDAGKFPKYIVPIIKFNGNTGAFSIRRVVDGDVSKEDEAISNPTITVLKRRSVLFSPLSSGQEIFTSEFSSPTDQVSIFDATGGTFTFVGTDIVSNVRNKYPSLKTKCVLYCLYEGEVVKLEVKGSSLSAFFEVQKKLQEDDKHLFEVAFQLKTAKAKNEQTKTTYYSIVFGTPALVEDFTGFEEALDTINAALEKQATYQASKNAGAPAAAPQPPTTSAGPAPSFDDVDPEDIPF